MEKINILYTGRHPEILETVVRLINQNENWNGFGSSNNKEVEILLRKTNFRIMLLGCGILENEEDELRKIVAEINPECSIVQHYGGGSGLLSNEIYAALNSINTQIS